MEPSAFIKELEEENNKLLGRLEPAETLMVEGGGRLDIGHLLKMPSGTRWRRLSWQPDGSRALRRWM